MTRPDTTLTWGGMKHWFRIWEDGSGTHGMLGVIKDKGTQTLFVTFPEGITVEAILAAWNSEAQNHNWVDLFPPVKIGGTFAVIRAIDLGAYRILWYVFHVDNFPQDALMVLKKPG